MAIVPQSGCRAPDRLVQLGCREPRANGADDLGQFLPLSQNRDSFYNREAGLVERMPATRPLFVLNDLRREFVLANRHDYIVGEPCSCADLVDAFLDLLVKCGIRLALGVSIAPALLVEIAPSVDQL